MNQFTRLTGGERLINQQSWSQTVTNVIKRRGAYVSRKQASIAERIENAHHGRFSRSRRADECKIWRDRRILLQPRADNKSGHQRLRICVEIKACSQNKTDFVFEVLGFSIRLGALSKPHIFQNFRLSRER